MSGRNRLAHADLLDASIGSHLVGDHVVHRQQEFHIVRLGVGENFRRQFHLVRLQQRLANLVSLRLEEGVGHAAADDEGIHLGHQVRDDADLVADLGAAQNRDEGLLWMR